MSLFKRLLISLFPKYFGGSYGPANMFLGLVNAKHFFTVITKRMVENPKLNLFDIGMDPVEVKIGFGNEANIKPKDLELYFSYCVCANLNGYKFYNPTNIAALLSISISQYFINDFERNKKGTDQFMVFLICINIVTYVFAARVKVFPAKMSKKDSFNRFVTLFFNYYTYLLDVYQIKISKKTFVELQAKLIAHSDIFFGLYYIFKKINSYLDSEPVVDEFYFEWLFADELKKGKHKADFQNFCANKDLYIYSSDLAPFEDKILDALMPAEILIKLLYNRDDVFWISEHIIPKVYEQRKMDDFIHSFLKSDAKVDEWLEHIMDHALRKSHFFQALKQMMIVKFNKNDPDHEDMEDMISSISDGMALFEIPDNLKKEGILMDRILNFYVGLMGSLWTGRGDTMYLRLYKNALINGIVDSEKVTQRLSITYYADLLHQYSKSSFFYKTIFDGVRSGKTSFMLPYVADVKEVYSSRTILKSLNENAICVLVQDILYKNIKLSIHQESVVNIFQSIHGKTISKWIKYTDNKILVACYSNLDDLLNRPVFVKSIQSYYQKSDIKNLKDNLYTLEFWLMRDLHIELASLDLKGIYTDAIVMNILAGLKDTFIGIIFLLHSCLQKQLQKKIDLKLFNLFDIYSTKILLLSPDISEQFTQIIYKIYSKYQAILELRIKIDENQYFLEVGVDCRWIFVGKENKIEYQISAEDALWLRGYLKHITYYNKRFIKPKL